MIRKYVSRIGLTTMATLAVGLGLNAQAQAPVSTNITFNMADGQTISKSAGLVKVEVTTADAAGLRSVAMSGGYSSAMVYPGGAKSAFCCSYFYVSYFPAGDYVFRTTATNSKGAQTTRAITLHLVN